MLDAEHARTRRAGPTRSAVTFAERRQRGRSRYRSGNVSKEALNAISHHVSHLTAPAQSFSGAGYDLLTTFDALHNMGDPAGPSAWVRACLKSDGTWLIVELYAADRLEGNLSLDRFQIIAAHTAGDRDRLQACSRQTFRG